MIAIDAHAHVFRRGLPLAAGRRYTPDADAPLDLYLRHLDRNGLTHGVLVQPSFLGCDNAFLLSCLRQQPARLRGIAVAEPGVSGEALERMDSAGVAGLRLNLVGAPLPGLATPPWRALFREAGRLGWLVEVQRPAADLPALALPLLDQGLTVVLDHWALPDPALGHRDPALASVFRLGATGRVWVKLSAPYRSRIATGRLYPMLRDAFGPQRLMWGSDWPHTQFEATETYEANRACLDAAVPSAQERAAILAAPAGLFRIPAPQPARTPALA